VREACPEGFGHRALEVFREALVEVALAIADELVAGREEVFEEPVSDERESGGMRGVFFETVEPGLESLVGVEETLHGSDELEVRAVCGEASEREAESLDVLVGLLEDGRVVRGDAQGVDERFGVLLEHPLDERQEAAA